MSYDLYFLQAQDCANTIGFFERIEQEPIACTTEAEARKHAIVEALRRLDPSLEPSVFDYEEVAKALGTTVEEARRAYSHVELNGPDRDGVQITVHGDHVSVTVAYWHTGAEAARVFSLVERYAAQIEATGQYRVYDPQIERIVDSFGQIREDVLEAYAGVVESVPRIAASLASTRKPWWKFW